MGGRYRTDEPMTQNRYRKRTEVVRFSPGSSVRSKNIFKNTSGKNLYTFTRMASPSVWKFVFVERHLRRPAGPPVCTERNVPGRTWRPLKGRILVVDLLFHFLPPLPQLPSSGNKRYAYYFSNFSHLHICLRRLRNGRPTEKNR